jgi:hypothetical protein
MLAAAGRAKTILSDSSPLVGDFFNNHLNDDGGFAGRDGKSDLYYTIFAIEALKALEVDFDSGKTLKYLSGFGSGKDLDFTHSASLARCLANLTDAIDENVRQTLLNNIENCRCNDGGYSHTAGPAGSIYGCFFATCCYQDMDAEIPDVKGMLNFIQSLQQTDGGYANQASGGVSMSPATAAALTILSSFGRGANELAMKWLFENCYMEGGFCAGREVPIPDLLSTATALHALSVNGFDVSTIRQQCLDFINDLWSDKGAFCASWADETLDCEYTYYGLLALGHLEG